MYYKILESKSNLDSEDSLKQEEQLLELTDLQSELIHNFMELNDSNVKIIHKKQDDIKKDLETVFKHSDSLSKTTKDAIKMYDEFVEYLKEGGDLFNYASILEVEMVKLFDRYNEIHSKPEAK